MQNGATELDCKSGYSPFPADQLHMTSGSCDCKIGYCPFPAAGSIPYDKWKRLVIIIVSEKISSFFRLN
jgi:hypothetical protein